MLVVCLDELVALGKTTLAKKLSFDVLAESNLAVLVLDLFFHNLRALVLSTVEVRLAAIVL